MTHNVSTFSVGSDRYARFRPTYPAELFRWLASLAPDLHVAWDCATGTGQAAVALADHFDRVIASDVSAEQVRNAAPHTKVSYAVGLAESSPLAEDSVDIVTVAQALHWFDLERFHAEVGRILKPGGVLAAWAYDFFTVSLDFDGVLREAVLDPIFPFWSTVNHLIFAGYRTIPFPFAEIETPAFSIEVTWSLDELCGYLSTWSAVKRQIAERGTDPLAAARDRLASAWGDGVSRRSIRMPLHLRVGRKA